MHVVDQLLWCRVVNAYVQKLATPLPCVSKNWTLQCSLFQNGFTTTGQLLMIFGRWDRYYLLIESEKFDTGKEPSMKFP